MDADTKTLAYNAACLWEDFLSNCQAENDLFYAVRSAVGMAECRDRLVDLAEPVERAWLFARENGFDDPFDWEFVPWFMRNCVTDRLAMVSDWEERIADTCAFRREAEVDAEPLAKRTIELDESTYRQLLDACADGNSWHFEDNDKPDGPGVYQPAYEALGAAWDAGEPID